MSEKLAFYIRLSNEDFEKGIYVQNQRDLLQSTYNERDDLHGYDIVEYVDDGYTGTNFDRPAFQSMLSEVKKGRIKCIIVKDFSRYARNYLDAGEYLEQIFPFMGVRFIAVNDNYDSDKNCGMTGGMDVAFKNLIYQMYSMDLSRKVKSARRNRNRNGECTASFVKYGYRKDPQDRHRLIIDEDVAPYVKEIFEKDSIISTDVFSTYRDGTQIGESAMIVIDSETGKYEKIEV